MANMQGWKSKLLSQAGKETLIKAVVQALPSYAMSCFEMPHSFCSKLNSLVRNYWWKGDPDNKGIPWTSWEHMTVPKNQGGMGFRDFKAFNQALLAKQGWRLLMNPNSLWARVYKGLYFPNSNFLQASRGRRTSWAWSSLLKGRALLLTGLRWQIQNGNLAHFWKDKWVPSSTDFKIASPQPPHCNVQTVADAIDPHRKIWKRDLLKEWLLPADLEAVLAIPIAAVNRDDLLIWHHNPSGVYSVKSGYALAKHIGHKSTVSTKPSSSLTLGSDFWNSIWALDIPPKIRHFWWRVCHNLLATQLGLFRRKCASSGECPICRKADETVEHLLFECPWTKAVWFGSSLNMRMSPGSITNVTRWTNDLLQGGNPKIESKRILSLVATVAWFIWKSRNDFVFNHQVVDPHVTLQKITHFWQEQDSLIGSVTSLHQATAVPNHNSQLGWQPAPHNRAKFNCDAAFCKSSSSAALAVILRDSNGNFLTGCAQSCKASSAAQAEAHSLRLACLMAKDLNLSRVEIASDNKSVISLCVSETVPPWEYSAIILDIRRLASSHSFSFSWTSRNNNAAAHWVAKACMTKALPVNWAFCPPAPLVSIFTSDVTHSPL